MTARALTVALALVCCGCAPVHNRPPAKLGGVAIGTHADSSVFVPLPERLRPERRK